jgi:folate-binding protein YgfZ
VEREQLEEQVRALDEARAFVRHPGMRLTWVGGSEARGWLQDLITADVAELQPFRTRRALLLSPTGRIRADLHVLGFGEARQSFVLARSSDQPEDLAELLGRYVLSSDVDLRPAPFEIVSVPGADETLLGSSQVWRPSVLGAGVDLMAVRSAVDRDVLPRLEERGLIEAEGPAVEAWRIRRGVPRFPIDLDEDSLPAEAGLDDEVVIDHAKGCYLGQESVAKVRNLGHPTRLVIALGSPSTVEAGDVVLARGAAGDEDVGVVTSADAGPDGSAVIARVRWEARAAELRTDSGAPLRPR